MGSRAVRVSFWIGWSLLVVLLVLFGVASHLGGIWYIAASPDEAQMFMLFFVVNVLTVVLLVIPYRQLQRWAWWAVWIGIVPFALIIAFGPPNYIGWMYLGVAAILAVGQFLALPRFLREGPAVNPRRSSPTS